MMAMAWFRSFYWRIAASFVVLVALVVVGQSAIFSYLLTRPSGEFAPPDPNRTAAIIAARVRAALDTDNGASLEHVLRDAARDDHRQRVYLVLRDGREAANTSEPLTPSTREHVRAVLDGDTPDLAPDAGPGGPVVTAPVQRAGILEGLVVLPPPPRRGPFEEVGRLLSLPGTVLLLVSSALAGALLFLPLRRRLRALERAAERLGAGEPGVRADDGGQDEIASLGRAFNRMSEELSERTAALHAADRARRQMLADVSHELRTPLTSMRGYLDTLAMPDVTLDEAARARYLETVRREAGRLERIVADVLDLARWEQGQSPLDVRLFAVERVFEHVVRRHEREAEAAGITLTAHVDPDADQLMGNPGRIEQVVGNLVANALRHTPRGGTVRLAAVKAGDDIRLSVEDTGPGIPAGHLPHVFDRFYKADEARAGGSSEGSGLGLSIARAIVERHGGTISVESRPGRTVFFVQFPGGTPAAPASSGDDQSPASANL